MSGAMYSSTTSLPEALQEGLIVKKYVGSQEYYECQVCQKSMAGIVPAQGHLEGYPHKKALQNLHVYTLNTRSSMDRVAGDGAYNTSCPSFSLGNQLPPSPEQSPSVIPPKSSGSCNIDTLQSALNNGIVREEVMGIQRMFTCTVCYISCTGDVPMKQHLSGQAHTKKQMKMKVLSCSTTAVVNSLEDDSYSSNSNPSPAVQAALPTQVLDDGQSSYKNIVQAAIDDGVVTCAKEGDPCYLTCKVCQSTCTGETPMKQHLRGNAHQKKLKARGLVFVSQQRSSITSPRNPENVNQRSNNTPPRNTENVDQRSDNTPPRITENVDQRSDNTPPRNTENVDQRSDNTPPRNTENVDQSLTSLQQVQSSSNEAREVVESAKDRGIVIEVDSTFECLICNISCTGVVPVTDHLKGEAHFKKLRDQIDYQQFMLQTIAVRDCTSPCPSFPARDEKSRETRLSTASVQFERDNHDAPDPVPQTVSSTVEDTGYSNISSDNVSKTTSKVKIYTSDHPLQDLFD